MIRGALQISHLIFLLICFALISHFHLVHWGALGFLVMMAWITEGVPRKGLKDILTPLSLVGSFFLLDGDGIYLSGWIRLSVVYLVLIPSRRHALAWLSGLITIDLGFTGMKSFTPNDVLIWLPVAVTALGLNAWLAARYGKRHAMRTRHLVPASIWKQCQLPVIAISVSSVLLAGLVMTVYPHYRQAEAPSLGRELFHDVSGFEVGEDIYDPWTSLSNTLILTLTPKTRISDRSSHYIRGGALSQLMLRNKRLIWQRAPSQQTNDNRDHVLHEAHTPRLGTLQYHKILSQTIFLPDGCAELHVNNRMRDSHDNLFFREKTSLRYLCDIGASRHPISYNESQQTKSYLNIPNSVKDELFRRLPEMQQWQSLPPHKAAEAIRLWLNARCVYTLNPVENYENAPGGRMLSFIAGPRQLRRGCCQQFASALGLIMRSLGHPSQCVAGFHSNEINDNGDIYFRERHGHAWVEYQVDGTWHRIDPTPPGSWDQRGLEESAIDPALAGNEEEEGDKWFWLISGLTLALLIWMGRRFTRDNLRRDIRIFKFRPQANPEGIIKLCHKHHVPVTKSSTVSQLVRMLEDKTGCSLEEAHQDYLLIRYGAGEGSHKWPEIGS